MKYINLFESWKDVELYYDNLLEEVKDLTEQSLAYLVDEGWEIDFRIWNTKKGYIPVDSRCINISIEKDEVTSWDSVKDRILPFLQLLERRYELEDSSSNRSDKPYVIYDESRASIFLRLRGICYSLQDLFDVKYLILDKISITINDKKK
jgi:hypothetical protein